MASNGAEDLRSGASRSALIVRAKSAVVHTFNTRVSSGFIERERHHLAALGDSLSLPNVTVAYDQPLHTSGISSQRAYTSVPAVNTTVSRAVRDRSAGVHPPNGLGNIGTRAANVVSKSSVYIRCSSTAYHSSSCLEATVQNYQPHWHLNPLGIRSRLLGKRSSSTQFSVYPTCPSPPKTSSRTPSVIVKRNMPTNQSYPWTDSTLKSSSKGVIQPSTTKVPMNVRLEGLGEAKDVEKHSTVLFVSRCNSGDKGDCTGVTAKSPISEHRSTDVPLNHILDTHEWPQYEKTVPEDTKENAHMVKCCVGQGTSEAPRRVRKLSSDVEFTTAVPNLSRSVAHERNRMINGMSTPPRTSLGPQRSTGAGKTGTTANATLPTKSSTSCLSNGNGESNMASSAVCPNARTEKHPSSSLSDAGTQSSTCAIPEEVSHKIDSLQSPTVYSVTNQISSIHLTKDGIQHVLEENPNLCSTILDKEHAPEVNGQKSAAVLQVGVQEEFPDELENDCSGNDNDGSECEDVSATSVAASSNTEDPMSPEPGCERVVKSALVCSLFPFMAPTLYFSTASETVEPLPLEQRKLLKWKMSSVTPNIVKHTIARSHFKVTKKSYDWLGCWGHHMKSPGFKTIREYQKLNHFPGSFQIGRKDRLWRNLSKMQARFGRQEFGFFPHSFVLPQDTKLLKKAWQDGGGRQKWIIKPPASARGIGIQVIHKWSQIPRRRPLLVQKYLHKPYLISGSKFDLRVYVYVTSYDPLRVYIFNDGLVRFASCKYSSSMKTLSNKFMHLTNYSVNKKNSEYQTNSDDKACQGHKWALKALWHYMGSRGINTTLIWEKIKDMVIKTIIASEPYVNTLLKMNVRSPYSCHELFGFDIMLDENLKPWVLEVNISPSLHSNSALDVSIKGQMIRDVLNLAGFVLPSKEDIGPSNSSDSSSTSSLCGAARDGSRLDLSADEKVKRAFYLTQCLGDQDFCSTVLEVLTPDDVRVLAESEDELSRSGGFERVFPSPASSRYLRFFEHPRYLNTLLNQWEQRYCQDRSKGIELLRSMCQKRVHLGNLDNNEHHWSSKSYNGYRSGSHSVVSAKTELTKSSITASQSSRAQMVVEEEEEEEEEDEDDWSDPEVKSLTSSLPDMSLLGSVNPSPLPVPNSLFHQDCL
ncbi:tubulin monoglutamylase TTLL4 [Brachyhypopomus gauderio]|uniref:tubulin monoglutamylase TTLL4 n=1 Tax=Brachyhypopomus gauderio TaxID=698409 RepID=UPI00404234BA